MSLTENRRWRWQRNYAIESLGKGRTTAAMVSWQSGQNNRCSSTSLSVEEHPEGS